MLHFAEKKNDIAADWVAEMGGFDDATSSHLLPYPVPPHRQYFSIIKYDLLGRPTEPTRPEKIHRNYRFLLYVA